MESNEFRDRELQDAEARLINWARWARSMRGAPRAACRSAERNYRPEMLRGDERHDRSQAHVPIDLRDAQLVFAIITPAHGFSKKLYLALSAKYILRLQGWAFCGYMRRHSVIVGRSKVEHELLFADALRAANSAFSRKKGVASVSVSKDNKFVAPGDREQPL